MSTDTLQDEIEIGWLLSWARERCAQSKALAKLLPNSERVSFDSYLTILHQLADDLDEPQIGLKLGVELDARNFGWFGRLLESNETLGEVFADLANYMSVFSAPQNLTIQHKDQYCFIDYSIDAASAEQGRHDVEFTLMLIVNAIRDAVKKSWVPIEVRLQHRHSADAELYQKSFGGVLKFNQKSNRLYFNSSVLDYAANPGDPELRKIVRAFADQLRLVQQETLSLENRVKSMIAETIGTASCEAQAIARELGMSERTFNRKLSTRGTTFRQLKREVTIDLAKSALGNSDAPISTIAADLGYSETASFSRAFKLSVGLSPKQFRDTPPTDHLP